MPNNDPQLQLLEQIASSLEELVKLTRVMSYPAVQQILETALDTDQKKLVYHLLDGTKTMATIQQLTGVNTRFISAWGQEWEKLGIVELTASGIRGRRQKSFDLSMFGIPIPEATTSMHDSNKQIA